MERGLTDSQTVIPTKVSTKTVREYQVYLSLLLKHNNVHKTKLTTYYKNRNTHSRRRSSLQG